jgi:hypothetical protein
MTEDAFEVDEKMNAYVTQIVQQLKLFGKRQDGSYAENYVMALATAVVSQVYISLGGDIDSASAHAIGEMIKQGIIATLKAYNDSRRVTHKPSGRIN